MVASSRELLLASVLPWINIQVKYQHYLPYQENIYIILPTLIFMLPPAIKNILLRLAFYPCIGWTLVEVPTLPDSMFLYFPFWSYILKDDDTGWRERRQTAWNPVSLLRSLKLNIDKIGQHLDGWSLRYISCCNLEYAVSVIFNVFELEIGESTSYSSQVLYINLRANILC